MKVFAIGNDYTFQLELDRRRENNKIKEVKEVDNAENKLPEGGHGVSETAEEQVEGKTETERSKRKKNTKTIQKDTEAENA